MIWRIWALERSPEALKPGDVRVKSARPEIKLRTVILPSLVVELAFVAFVASSPHSDLPCFCCVSHEDSSSLTLLHPWNQSSTFVIHGRLHKDMPRHPISSKDGLGHFYNTRCIMIDWYIWSRALCSTGTPVRCRRNELHIFAWNRIVNHAHMTGSAVEEIADFFPWEELQTVLFPSLSSPQILASE